MTLKQYIEGRIKYQQDLLESATENGRAWREIIIQELRMVLQHLPAKEDFTR